MKKVLYLSILIITVIFSCTKDGGEVSGVSVDNNGSGKAGSMAKFSINGNHLFLINEHDLKIYDITNEDNPQLLTSTRLDFGIETVFSLGDYLYIGSSRGMYIYDISNASNIKYMSFYQHITSCDPVVANDSLAFVTLNTGRTCNWEWGEDRFDVLDISDKLNPVRIYSGVTGTPLGLGLNDHYVFICKGIGVSYYDFSNPHQVNYVGAISGVSAYDMIIQNDIMYLIGKDGLFQYQISDINNIILISNILFN